LKFKKGSIIVEASLFIPTVRPWPEGVVASTDETGDLDSFKYYLRRYDEFGEVHRVEIAPGDWIVKEAENEYPFACKPDVFAVIYQKEEF
jgi:hypothetical protein